MVHTKEGVKRLLKEMIKKRDKEFTTSEMKRSLVDNNVKIMGLQLGRVSKYIQGSGLVKYNKSSKTWVKVKI